MRSERHPAERISLIAIALILGAAAFHAAAPLLKPWLFALFLSFILRPAYMGLRRWKLPRPAAASLTVGALLSVMIGAVSLLADPAGEWLAKLPDQGPELRRKATELLRPAEEVGEKIRHAMDQVDDVTKKIEGLAGDKTAPIEVAVKDPEDSPIVGMKDTVWFLGVVGVLSFLFLCHGRSIAVCLGKLTGMGDKIHVIGSDVSRYLSTITLINACLGAAIALAMWLTGMPNPLLWGVVGALLNFVPVLGALAGTLLILIVATLSFDTPGAIALPTLSYFALTATEGNVLTPMILGKRFNINPVIVFLWLCLWAWVWGVAGALLAVPLLVAVQHFASSLQPLNWFSELCGSCSDESVEGGEGGASAPGATPDPDTAPTAPG